VLGGDDVCPCDLESFGPRNFVDERRRLVSAPHTAMGTVVEEMPWTRSPLTGVAVGGRD
jgi:hypothetical protein